MLQGVCLFAPMRVPQVFPRRAVALLAWAALAPALLADTVTLKSGEKIEGKVLSETDTEVVIEYKVSASITDSRTVPKAEVASVDKAGPDVAAYEAIKNLKPGPFSQPAENYERIIAALQNFVNTYAASTHVAEVKETLAQFQAEKGRVDGGEVKIAGNWLSKEQAEKEKYQIQAQLYYGQMQTQVRAGDYIGALTTFDALEKQYNGARAFPDAVDFAKKVVVSLRQMAERALPVAKQKAQERTTGLALLSEPQKSEVAAAQKRELDAMQARLEAASKGKQKWPPYMANYDKSLEAVIKATQAEQKRLEALPVPKMRQSIAATEQALIAREAKDFAKLETSVREAQSAWPQNEELKRLNVEVSKEKLELAKATPTPKPTPTPRATPNPEEVAKQAEIMKKAQEAAAAEEAPLFTPFRIVLALVVLALAVAAWKAYSKIRNKANEIIE